MLCPIAPNKIFLQLKPLEAPKLQNKNKKRKPEKTRKNADSYLRADISFGCCNSQKQNLSFEDGALKSITIKCNNFLIILDKKNNLVTCSFKLSFKFTCISYFPIPIKKSSYQWKNFLLPQSPSNKVIARKILFLLRVSSNKHLFSKDTLS